jgi:MutS-like protein
LPPFEHYQERLEHWRAAHARSEKQYRLLVRARLGTGLAAVAIAALALGATLISPWWLVAPLIALVILVMVHSRVDQARSTEARALAYYERSLARLSDRWIGGGNQGERFRDPKHVYADDLDLFGRGSLFEMLSTARTGAGESTLARWLLAPGDAKEVIARQAAVEELRERVDLREQLALMGEDIRAAVDAKALGNWGGQPPVPFFRGARVVALALVALAVLTLALFFAHVFSLLPFLVVLLGELIFNLSIRDSVGRVTAAVSTPAQELFLLGLLFERLEKEPFQSPRLVALKGALGSEGLTASEQIRRLERLVGHLISARNMFFSLAAAVLLWTPQFAMAIEAWRVACGPRIGRWIAAIGEFEALCALAGFAYERPQATFPELLEQSDPLFEASGLKHPLIPPVESIANDVAIGGSFPGAARLWIVSGSNMSGKSTLMRAIGLNAVLAWAGAPVTCSRLRISPLYIGASMRANDSVIDHRSRFYAEIERLRDIVNLSRGGKPTLFLLDELLSGTNSHDRRIGAEALVRGLVKRGAIGLVTTHDLALAQIAEMPEDALGGKAINVHFEDHLEGGQMLFDYRLRPGVVTRSNALELMRAVGLDV